jgi:RNA polymerase sigma-70 factor, ECF subfamily
VRGCRIVCLEQRVNAHRAGNEQRAMVRAALAQIPPEQRQAIELAFFSGLTHEEIAAQLATPLGPIKARIRRGMIRMRELVME